ncbi:hypothetical protein BJX70DRAFT_397836 [Aspergillus crustosus]
MALLNLTFTIYAIATIVITLCHAQKPTGTSYTDPTTNITFSTWSIPSTDNTGPLTFGLTLPSTALKTDATEFIGYLKCTPAKGWCGISLGGAMTDSLLLVAYANPDLANQEKEKDEVQIALRYTTRYTMPSIYTGNATITTIRSEVTEDSFTTIFHCKDCLHWKQGESEGGATTRSGSLDLAYAISPEGPSNAVCPAEARFVQHKMQGTWVAFVDEKATSTAYEEWVGLGKGGVAGCPIKR